MAAVLWIDFGAAVEPDDALPRLFDRLAPGAWQEFRRHIDEGGLTREQALAALLAKVQADTSEIAAATRETMEPASGFLELYDWAHWHGWFPVVAGVVPDAVMNTVLDATGVDRVARQSGRMRFTYQWRLSFLSPRGIEVEDGFTTAYMQAFQRARDLVVYVGGDPLDVDAAGLADVVFARGGLLEALQGHHDRLVPFASLDDVVATMDRDGEAWRAELSKAGGAP